MSDCINTLKKDVVGKRPEGDCLPYPTVRASDCIQTFQQDINRIVPDNTIDIVFYVSCQTNYGEEVRVVGNHWELGHWDPSRAPRMTWTDNHVWVASISLPVGEPLEYKYVITGSDGQAKTWEPCENRILHRRNGSDGTLLMDSPLGSYETSAGFVSDLASRGSPLSPVHTFGDRRRDQKAVSIPSSVYQDQNEDYEILLMDCPMGFYQTSQGFLASIADRYDMKTAPQKAPAVKYEAVSPMLAKIRSALWADDFEGTIDDLVGA